MSTEFTSRLNTLSTRIDGLEHSILELTQSGPTVSLPSSSAPPSANLND